MTDDLPLGIVPTVIERLAEALAVPGRGADPLERLMSAAAERRRENLTAILAPLLERRVLIFGDGDLSADWLLRFLERAANACDPDLQALWGRVLTQELRRPGNTSLGALEVLSRIGVDDLPVFHGMARLAMSDFVVRVDDKLLEDRGLTADALARLEELGLLRGGAAHVKNFSTQIEDGFRTHLLYRDTILRIAHDETSRQLSLPVHRLTRAGAELAWTVDLPSDFDYVMAVSDRVRRQRFRVLHSRILRWGTDRNQVTRHSGFTEIFTLGRGDENRGETVTG